MKILLERCLSLVIGNVGNPAHKSLCYSGIMVFFNNYWFRGFIGGVITGASLAAIAAASNQLKDLKIESASGRFVFTGKSAWVIVGALMGLSGGLVGVGTAAITKLARRSPI
ncbi:hypothetical protein IAD21_01177 [Abditibacteriota bacterium]|nr:hypothetical protein IAD21_01177 [Abditibacteriota bacterium]